MRGKTIEIYIPDGNPRGIKICDIRNSIVKAIYIPRNKITEAVKRTELNEPGIYLLIGGSDDNIKSKIYIGEADPLFTRLKQHNLGKDFWNFAICFISEKKNINKAHIKYLENICHSDAQKIGKCYLENSVLPTQSTLNEQEVDFVLSIYDDIKILVATLGYDFLEESKTESKNIFYCKGRDAKASGEYSEKGFIVYKNSLINIDEAKGIGVTSHNIRKKLLNDNILVEKNNTFILTQDYVFNSPSTAASFVLARSANGWTEWHDVKHRTLDDRYRKVK